MRLPIAFSDESTNQLRCFARTHYSLARSLAALGRSLDRPDVEKRCAEQRGAAKRRAQNDEVVPILKVSC